MAGVGVHHHPLAGQLGDAVDVVGIGQARFGVRIVPGPSFAAEDVVGRVEDHPGPDLFRGAGDVAGAGGIDGKGQSRVQLAVVDAMEGGGVDDPVGAMLAQDAGDADAVGDVDVGVGQTDRVVAEGPHQVLTELPGRADDQCPHAGTPAMIVSFSQRMLKKRGSLSGSRPKSPRSRAS